MRWKRRYLYLFEEIAGHLAGIEEALAVLAIREGGKDAEGKGLMPPEEFTRRVEAEAQRLSGDRLDRAEGEGRR